MKNIKKILNFMESVQFLKDNIIETENTFLDLNYNNALCNLDMKCIEKVEELLKSLKVNYEIKEDYEAINSKIFLNIALDTFSISFKRKLNQKEENFRNIVITYFIKKMSLTIKEEV